MLDNLACQLWLPSINLRLIQTQKSLPCVKKLYLQVLPMLFLRITGREGGTGAVDLAKSVIKASSKDKDFKLLYNLDGDIQGRIEKIGQVMYGADKVEFSELAQKKVDSYQRQGFGNLPICIAKTQYSLSHDPALKGAPTGFTIPIRDVRLAVGAGYL